MVDTSVQIGTVNLPHPIMPGSGTMGDMLGKIINLNDLAAIVLKTITPDVRDGTKPPRVAELERSTLFSIGIPSRGPDYFMENTLPLYQEYSVPVIASISADTADDFGFLANYISSPEISAVEANISCPNLRENGRAFGMSVKSTVEVVKKIKGSTDTPVWVKLTPNVADIRPFAVAAESAGADAVIVGNAVLGMAVDAEEQRPLLGNVFGGVTGAAIKPIMIRMVHQCYQEVSIPVIGCGGISSGEDVAEYMLAGATAVQIGTANFIHPSTIPNAKKWLVDYCNRKKVRDVSSLIGNICY